MDLHSQLRERAGSLINVLDSLEKTLGKEIPLDFPQIIVIGDESSGKSTLMERIAMFEFFPKRSGSDQNLTILTRMPIQLRLQHMSPQKMKDFCAKNELEYVERNCVYLRFKFEGSDGRTVT